MGYVSTHCFAWDAITQCSTTQLVPIRFDGWVMVQWLAVVGGEGIPVSRFETGSNSLTVGIYPAASVRRHVLIYWTNVRYIRND